MVELPYEEKIKQYLYGELADEEAFETELFETDELFYDLKTLENDLVDRFARGLMTAQEIRRFEAGLSKFPARREKLANAIALQSHIESIEKPAAIALAGEKQSRRQSFFNFFNFPVFAFRYAMAVALILLTIGGGWLYYRRSISQTELAEISNDSEKTRLREQNLNQSEPQNKIDETDRRDQNLQPSPTAQTIQRPQNEANRVRENEEKRSNSSIEPKPAPRRASNGSPILAIALSPLILTRSAEDDDGGAQIRATRQTKTVNLSFELPSDANAERYNVKLAETVVRTCVRARTGKDNVKRLNISLPLASLQKTNAFVVTECGATGNFKKISEYRLGVIQ